MEPAPFNTPRPPHPDEVADEYNRHLLRHTVPEDNDGTVDPPSASPAEAFRVSPASIFNVSVPDEVMVQVAVTKSAITAAQLRSAWAVSPLSHLQIVPMDRKFTVMNAEAWEAALPHVGTNRLRYIPGQWVCREYSALFACISAGVLGVDGVGRVMDFSGQHSYNCVCVPDSVAASGYRILIIEPQTDKLVPKLDPARHYVATSGFCTWG